MSFQPSLSASPYPQYSLRSSNSQGSMPPLDLQKNPTATQQPLGWNPAQTKYPYAISASECADCNTVCTDECATSDQLTSQCTEQCVVITCSDPEHQVNGFDGHSSCDSVCDSGTDCADRNGFDAFLQCYGGDHPCHVSQQQQAKFSQQRPQRHWNQNSWDSSISASLCDCGFSQGAESISPSTSATTFASATTAPISPSATGSTSHRFPPSIGTYQSSSAETFAPIRPSFSPILQTQAQNSLQYNASQNRQHHITASSSSSPSTPMLTCMWGSCQARFSSLGELVGHVNLAHLRIPTDTDVSTDRTNPSQAQLPTQQDDATRLPCLWGNCNEFLEPHSLAGTSSASLEDIMLSNLASHLFQDHLGLQRFNAGIQSNNLDVDRMLAEMMTPPSQLQGRERQAQYSQICGVARNSDSVLKASDDDTGLQQIMQEVNAFTTPSPRTTTTVISSPATSSSEVTPVEGHVCQWEGCGKMFETCDDLMSHMSNVHVGSGKPQYDCMWEGCRRNGDKGFSSKQKICRHLQSHTGYRPFQCPECLQNFSEAATLQQHIRRHTQEKPYKCDFPGCGKSFAITGALTIHKRIHNGQKPFKCSYCGRGFAESSNLSKHLRTHTGERPYVCPEPGCGKAFARPDQLTRHAGVHRKKASTTAVED